MPTQDSENLRHSKRTVFGTMALVCFTSSTFELLLLHLLRRDYAPRNHMISDYGVGPYSWVITACFVGMGGGILMLLLGLIRHGPRSGLARIGTALLGIPTIGVVVSAIYPTDLPGAPLTRSGEIHDLSFLANVVVIVLCAVLLSFSFGSDSHWHLYRRTALVWVSLIVIALVLQFLTFHQGMPYGYTNRLFVGALFGCFFGTSIRLGAVARGLGRFPHSGKTDFSVGMRSFYL